MSAGRTTTAAEAAVEHSSSFLLFSLQLDHHHHEKHTSTTGTGSAVANLIINERPICVLSEVREWEKRKSDCSLKKKEKERRPFLLVLSLDCRSILPPDIGRHRFFPFLLFLLL